MRQGLRVKRKNRSWVEGNSRGIRRSSVVAVRVGAQLVGSLLVDAELAAHRATVDAVVVEGRVVRAEFAAAAVPQSRHGDYGCIEVLR